MTEFHIFDGNNYARLVLEHDRTGSLPRTIYETIHNTSGVVLFIWDGERGSAKRREIYPDYKRNRKPLSSSIYANFELLEEVLKHSKALQVKVPGYEADDVIATLARSAAREGFVVNIYSNDADMLQLAGEFPDKIFTGAKIKDDVPPHLIKYYKVVVGDSSDNIPGIQGFGAKAWEQVNKQDLVRYIDSVVSGQEPTVDLNLPPRCRMDHQKIRDFWRVVSFIDVPGEVMSQHMTPGTPNFQAADELMKRYLL